MWKQGSVGLGGGRGAVAPGEKGTGCHLSSQPQPVCGIATLPNPDKGFQCFSAEGMSHEH